MDTGTDISEVSFKDVAGTMPRPEEFLSCNTSFPGDADGDVLPYPTPGARHDKQRKTVKEVSINRRKIS